MSCNINTLLSSAASNGFFSLQDRELRICVLQLLCDQAPQSGIVDPNGAVTGSPGQTYVNTASGKVFVKTSGVGTNTGWTQIN